MKGFKNFLMRGNVIDLAVAVVIGAAFGTVVSAFVRDLLTPIIAAIGGKPDFSTLAFTINGSRFQYGDFINSVIAFLFVAAAVYYLVVVPLAHMKKTESVSTRKCPECLSDIPSEAHRCAQCGQPIASITPLKREDMGS